jgi:hypothetical protein
MPGVAALQGMVPTLPRMSFPVRTATTPGVLPGRLNVQACDACVRIWAAEEGGVQRARHGDIVDLLPQTLDQRWILTPLNPLPDEFW